MRLTSILVLWCACAATADVARLKAGKAALIRKLAGRHSKRGVLGSVPTYKVGHDIPYVTHSVLKPLLVTYPPTAVPFSVKVPVTNPIAVRYPVGHKHHSHFHKKFMFGNPGPNYHHHHHNVAPRPIIPVAPAPPVIPAPTPVAPLPAPPLIPQASVPVPRPLPLPQPFPPVLLPSPAPSVNIIPQQHVHLRPTAVPLLPAGPVAFQPTAAQVFPVAPQYPYVIRPGGAVQTSVFATYPKYPVLNYAPPLIPNYDQLYLDRPQVQVQVPQVPQYQLIPQPTASPTLLQAAHTPLPLEHDGWSPLQPQHPEPTPYFPQEHATQVYEAHADQHYHDQHYEDQLRHQFHDQVQHQLQDQVHHQFHELEHVQHQIQELEHAQLEHQLHNQHQPSQEYGPPQQEHGQPNQEYPQSQQEYGQPNQEYHLPQEYSQHRVQQEYGPPDRQPGSEYGAPGFEGRSGEDDGQQEQAYHNHIPLGLQPPIDRPLEHF